MDPTPFFEEYADPTIYDLENAAFEPDGAFYLALARQTGGPLLELGCGTGRIALPMAAAGFSVTGLDITPAMLARAQEKALQQPGLEVEWRLADARQFDLGRTFRLIYEPGAVFQHLLERSDHEAFLACISRHLHPEGRFVLSLLFPSPERLAAEEDHEVWAYEHPAGYTVRVSFRSQYDPLRQVNTETATRRWTGPDGVEQAREAPLALRIFYPQELEALLHYNGFTILERCGDWEHGPLHAESEQMLFICGLSS